MSSESNPRVRRRTQTDDGSELEAQTRGSQRGSTSSTPEVGTVRRRRRGQTAASQSQSQSQANGNHDGPEVPAGVIKEVVLLNFLTHSNLEVPLGPKVNFLNGQNGSGKSAVLASIMIALGARANNTGRGQKLSNLIQDGKSYCSITVKLCNAGQDAYRPEIFGDEIQICRRINRTGGGTYTIKDTHARVVSHNKRDLVSILDHFNIQVDNSLTWLTQDAAKEFLMNVKDTSLYEFFARGADIIQTEKNLAELSEKITDCVTSLNNINDSLTTLKNKRMEAKQRAREIEAAIINLRHLAVLDRELDWLNILKMEHVVEQLNREIAAQDAKIEEATREAQSMADQKAEAEENLRVLEFETDIGLTPADLNALQTELGAAMTTHRNASAQLRSLEEDLRNAKIELGEIRTERERIDRANSGPGEEQRRQLAAERDQLTTQIAELDAREAWLTTEIARIRERTGPANEQVTAANRAHQQTESEISRLSRTLENIEATRRNRVNTWGHSMDRLLAVIDRTPWRGAKPVGPAGLYVKPKRQYMDQWIHVLRALVGNPLHDFIVTDHQDRRTLSTLIQQHRLPCRIVKVHDIEQPMDLRGHLPNSDYLTVRDTLEITHPAVERMLCVTNNIESRILIASRRDAERETANGFPPNVSAVYIPSGHQIGSRSGMLAIQAPVRWARGRNCPFGLTGDEDPEAVRAELDAARAKLPTTDAARQQARTELQQLQGSLAELEREQRTFRPTRGRMTSRLNAIATQLEEIVPTEVSTIETEEREQAARVDMLEAQKPMAQEEVQRTAAAVTVVQQRLDEARELQHTIRANMQSRAAKCNEQRTMVQRFHNYELHYRSKIEEYAQRRAEHVAQREEQQVIIDQAVVEMGTARPAQIRSKEELDQEKRRIQTMAATVQQRYGHLDFGRAEKEYLDAKAVYDTAKAEQVKLGEVLTTLKRSLNDRATRFTQLKNHISNVASLNFRKRMAKRGYLGELIFDHGNKTLKVNAHVEESKAAAAAAAASGHGHGMSDEEYGADAYAAEADDDDEDDDDYGTGGGSKKKKAKKRKTKGGDDGSGGSKPHERSIRTYSGGEKSFSTVCLLLALWDAMPSPIRCLDEFDVYMDEVNRRMAMQLLMGAAKTSESQFVFITPLSISNIGSENDPDVRVCILPPPQRNNVV
ncbi:Structural maintenance of chromosomes protein 6 [Blastocladiella emersonii ATCC 22665]|nr:Structural maintenance of chromosomes protein 6 [Blastocladiella emersonii ATCC 22665]